MIKIIHVQRHLPTSGNAAYRLHGAFLKACIDSSMLSLSSDLAGSERIKHLNVIHQLVSQLDMKLLNYLTRKSATQYGLFSFPVLGTDITALEIVKQADIIYLHWINGGFLNLHSIERLAKLNKPIVFYMHDMWAITGGCHHSFTCERYKTECQSCQIFNERKRNDLSRIEFFRKKKLYANYSNLYFITPSKWLYTCARQSALTINKPIFYIPNLINNELFKPFDKHTAKRILNIDPDTNVISFGAISVNSPYKGLIYLIKALKLLRQQLIDYKILILIFGSDSDGQVAEEIPFATRFIGKLRDDLSTLIMYNASDVFLAPSLADNLPTTVMESLCCETPVVGFNVGGIPDMIEHKKNGYLAKYRDPQDLATGIKFCLDEKIKGKLLENFAPDKIIKKHLGLFEELKINQVRNF